jgi:hypothetical protein
VIPDRHTCASEHYFDITVKSYSIGKEQECADVPIKVRFGGMAKQHSGE